MKTRQARQVREGVLAGACYLNNVLFYQYGPFSGRMPIFFKQPKSRLAKRSMKKLIAKNTHTY